MSEKSDWEQGYDQAMRRTYDERIGARKRIAELEAENKGYRMLIQDWIDIFDPQFTKRFSFIDGVRLAMIESIKEREKNG